MSSGGKKLLPEEELEKQYRDYKAQFDQWKEKNKGSEGTEGYIKYVKDFEKWEKEVEQRRIAVRNKSEQERKQTVERNVVVEEQEPQDEASVAARYAREQQQYTAMHMRGIQDQERQQAMQRQKHRPPQASQNFNAVPPPEQQHLQHVPIHQHASANQQYTMHPQQQSRILGDQSQGSPMPLSSIVTQQPQTEQYDLTSSLGEAIRNGPHIRADPQPSTQQQQITAAATEESRPMLWGPEGADYLPADSMFLKWGLHALPPNLKTPYHPPHSEEPITPCWYLMKKMEEKGLFYGHNVNLNGIPDLIPQQMPNGDMPIENGHYHGVANGVSEPVGQPNVNIHDFSRPPPSFDMSRPPPASMIPPTSIMSQPPPLVSQPFNMGPIPALNEQIQFNMPPPSAPFRA